MRDLRLWRFQLAQFARNGYFVELLATTTLTMVALQALAGRAPGASSDGMGWVRAGTVGMWTVCTVAAGMIGFQRFQGTLVHLLHSPMSPARVLLPVLGAASVFGLAAFPLAAAFSTAMRQSLHLASLRGVTVGAVLLWLACLALSSVVGTTFVLTPNAMTYEGLLAVPLVLCSGVFGTPGAVPSAATRFLDLVIPTRGAVETLLGAAARGDVQAAPVLSSLCSSAAWLALGALSLRAFTKRALSAGTLDLL